MAKGNSGGTRNSNASAPTGLSASGGRGEIKRLQAEADTIVRSLNNRNLYSNDRLLEIRAREETLLDEQLKKEAGKNGWKEIWDGSISKKLGDDEPIMIISVQRGLNKMGENGYFEAHVGGARAAYDNKRYMEARSALWDNDKRFSTPEEAIKWIEREAGKINKRYKGKI